MPLLRALKHSLQHRNRGQRTQARRARLFLEPLEHRITPDVTLHDGHLIVNGELNAFAQFVSLDVNGIGGVLVGLNGKDFSFSPGEVFFIEVDTLAGHDYFVQVIAILPGMPLTINSANDSEDNIALGKGDDSTLGDNGSLDKILGPVTISKW